MGISGAICAPRDPPNRTFLHLSVRHAVTLRIFLKRDVQSIVGQFNYFEATVVHLLTAVPPLSYSEGHTIALYFGLQVSVAEFNSKPILCSVTGCSLPGISKEAILLGATGSRVPDMVRTSGVSGCG